MVNTVPIMPAGLNGVSPKMAAVTMSKITKGATKRMGSSSGTASNRKMVVPDNMFSSPALALVAVSLMHSPHLPGSVCPMDHHGLVRKLL